jgi:hypothetical protein
MIGTFPSEASRVSVEKEIRQCREYRTRRLVLQAWDALESGGAFARMGMG